MPYKSCVHGCWLEDQLCGHRPPPPPGPGLWLVGDLLASGLLQSILRLACVWGRSKGQGTAFQALAKLRVPAHRAGLDTP